MANISMVEKSYGSAFLLDKSKLSRIVNVIENRFNDLGIKSGAAFNATLQNGKVFKLASLDELFSLDNTVHNPISSLEVEIGDSQYPPYLGLPKASVMYKHMSENNISVRVDGFESALGSQLFAELEEQIERTFLKDWAYKITRGGWFSFIQIIVVLLTMVLLIATLPTPFERSNGTTQFGPEYLVEQYSGAATQEEKTDFIFYYLMRQLESEAKEAPVTFDVSRWLNLQTLFVALPILIVVVTIIYIFAKCYPRANFLWGDYEEHYSQLKSRRSTLWNLVIFSTLIGIIGNLFVMGLAGYLKLGQ